MKRTVSFILLIFIIFTLIQPVCLSNVNNSSPKKNMYRVLVPHDSSSQFLKKYLAETSLKLFDLKSIESEPNYGLFLLQPRKYGKGVKDVFNTSAVRTGGYFDIKVKVSITRINGTNITFKVSVTIPRVDSIKGWKLYNNDKRTLSNKTIVTLPSKENSANGDITLRDLNLYYGFVVYPDINSGDTIYENQQPKAWVKYDLEKVNDAKYQPVKLIIDDQEVPLESKYASELLDPYTGENIWSKVKEKVLEKLIDELNNSLDHKLYCFGKKIYVNFNIDDFDITPIDIRISSDKHIIRMTFSGSFQWTATCKYYKDGKYQGSKTISDSGEKKYSISNPDSNDGIHGSYGGYTHDYLVEVSSTYLLNNVIPSYSPQEERIVEDGPYTNGRPTIYTYISYVGGIKDILEGQSLDTSNYIRAYVVKTKISEDGSTVTYSRVPMKKDKEEESYSIGFLLANVRGATDNLFTTQIYNDTDYSSRDYIFGDDTSWSATKTAIRSWKTKENRTKGNETITITHYHKIYAEVHATIKLYGKAKLYEEDVKSILRYKQILIPHIIFKVGVVNYNDFIEDKVINNINTSYSPFALQSDQPSKPEIEIIPALAPLNGTGTPTKLVSVFKEISNPSIQSLASSTEGFTKAYNTFMGDLLPTYFPIACPKEMGLNRFIRGEYLGFYAITPTIKIPEYIDWIPGIPVMTIFAETLTAKYENAAAVINPDPENFNIHDCKSDDCKIVSMTLGIGVGSIGDKVIGSRIYIVPSKSIDAEAGNKFTSVISGGINKLMDGLTGLGEGIFSFIYKDKTIRRDIKSIRKDLQRYGSYIQFTVYFSGEKDKINPPIAVFVTPKTIKRFIINDPGKLVVNTTMYILHIKVIKPALLPIPIIIPIVLKIESNGSTNINVDNVRVLPIALSYDPIAGEGMQSYNKKYIEDIYDSLGNRGVYIYAVPVWDETGEPILLRGSYKDSSMILEAVYGNRIKYTNITDLGIPSSPIKLEYYYLYKLDNVKLITGWRIGKRIILEESQIMPMKPFIINLTKLRAWTIDLSRDNITLYIGKYTEETLPLVNNEAYADKVYDDITELNDKFLSVKTVISNQMDLLIKRIRPKQDLKDLTEDFIMNMYEQINTTVTLIIENLAVTFIKNIVSIIIDPTGGIVASFVSKFVDYIVNDIINNYLYKDDSQTKIYDLVKSMFFTVADWVTRTIVANMLEEYIKPALMNYIDNILNSIYDSLGKDKQEVIDTLLYNTNTMFLTSYTLRTRPSLINTIYYVSIDGKSSGTIINPTINKQYFLPYSIIELPDDIKNKGGVFFVESSSLVNILLGDFFGVNTNEASEATISIDVGNLLRYVGGWIKYVNQNILESLTKDQLDEINNVVDKMNEIATAYDGIIERISSYVVINGLSASEILLPAVIYIPPTSISVSHQSI